MRRLWLCLGLSLLLHALFFPDFLQAMLRSGATSRVADPSSRVQV
jgi:hypothetical protein